MVRLRGLELPELRPLGVLWFADGVSGKVRLDNAMGCLQTSFIPVATPDSSREELEDLCRRRVASAKLRLDFARQYLTEVQRDFPLNDTSPDGQYATQHALRAENFALAEYRRVLRVYTDLVDGTLPDEDWQRRMPPDAGM